MPLPLCTCRLANVRCRLPSDGGEAKAGKRSPSPMPHSSALPFAPCPLHYASMHVAGHKQRPPLHPQEKWFLGIVLVQLIFMPWAFGTMHVWSQVLALGLGVLGFGVALWPRTYSGDFAISFDSQHHGQNAKHTAQGVAYRLSAWPRLVRFPLFWLGGVLLGYIGLQAMNPSWIWERNATIWWLRRVTDLP